MVIFNSYVKLPEGINQQKFKHDHHTVVLILSWFPNPQKRTCSMETNLPTPTLMAGSMSIPWIVTIQHHCLFTITNFFKCDFDPRPQTISRKYRNSQPKIDKLFPTIIELQSWTHTNFRHLFWGNHELSIVHHYDDVCWFRAPIGNQGHSLKRIGKHAMNHH